MENVNYIHVYKNNNVNSYNNTFGVCHAFI